MTRQLVAGAAEAVAIALAASEASRIAIKRRLFADSRCIFEEIVFI
jgi:hypothetical protein